MLTLAPHSARIPHEYTAWFPVRHAGDRLDIAGLIADGFASRTREILLTFESRAWTFGAMAARVAQLRGWLSAYGVGNADRIALMLGNEPDLVALIYAAALSGVEWVPINTKYKAPGVAHLLGDCRPRLVITGGDFAPVIEQALAQCAHACRVVRMPAGDDAHAGAAATATAPVPDIEPSDTLCVLYTSGTTGPPKGVPVTHRMLRIAGEAAARVSDLRDSDQLLLWEPLCHIGGVQMLVVPFLARVQLHLQRGFSASHFWEQVEATGATQLHYLGGILDILAGQPEASRPRRHTIRIAWGAGVSAQAWQRVSQSLGLALRECYGMTECSSFATANLESRPGSIGKPLPWIEVELHDEHGRPIPDGERAEGEIVLSSDLAGVFMPGYLDDAAATANALRGGKLHTGDIARRDSDGFLYFVGRCTDSMRVRGENVSAWEVERIFAGHPAVKAVAAVGVKGGIGEHEILLYVQYREGCRCNTGFADLAAWADPLLARFQQPRYYREVAQFDMTPSERVRKHLLPRDISGAWDRWPG